MSAEPHQTDHLGELGEALRDAVAEVDSGKIATAYVDFPAEYRTVVESGGGDNANLREELVREVRNFVDHFRDG